MNIRKTFLVSVLVVLLVALGAWWYLGFTFDFMRFFAAEPGVSDATPTPATSGRPVPEGCQLQGTVVTCPRVSCAAQTPTVSAGAVVTIHAYGGSGGYTFTAPGGVITINSGTDTAGIRYDTEGIKQVLVTSIRASDETLTDVAACTVIVVPAAGTN